MYDWCMIRCFCASIYKLYHGKMMILCKHGLTEIIMIYCIANQPKNAIFAEKWGGKAFIWGGKPHLGQKTSHLGRKTSHLGRKTSHLGQKPPNWHIYFSHYGYFKEIGH